MLRLKSVDVHYGRIHAVRRASMHVDAGEIVALIGGNGAGKTTLLTTVSGLIRPSAGVVEFEGKDLRKVRPERVVRLGVSHVPEGRLVFAPLSVEDNLRLGGYVRKDRKQAGRDMEEMYEFFPVLGERRGQLAGTLSGGEQQMLAIARALMARPRMLLLDEPSMGLAPNITKDIFRHLTALRRELNLTLLLVEQNARSALKIADRGYVLETGRIVLQGQAHDLLANHDAQRAY
ncbi:MAG: ABC transporter ATP-binding protein, partial [Desulfovibrionaceae bacterium]